MRKIYFSTIVVLFVLLSFTHLSCVKSITETKEEKTQRLVDEVKAPVKYSKSNYNPEFFDDIACDSLYPNKKYTISLKGNFENVDDDDHNSEFIFYQIKDGKKIVIFKDSIFIQLTNVIKFEDFNNDNVKDVLIKNISDLRSNWTYNLYLVDLKKDKLKKIKGFNEIKNPHYLPKYNIIDNEVMSGRIWTSFYQIKGDTIKNFRYEIYRGEDENRNPDTYEEDYKHTLNQILKNKKIA